MVTLVVDREKLSVPEWVTNLDSFRRWLDREDLPDHARVWFLQGEVWIDMSWEQQAHNGVKTEITSVLHTLVKAAKSGLVFSDRMRLTNSDIKLSGIPDMMFVSHEAFSSGRVQRIPGKEGGCIELNGTPDMVLEVVSDSSEKKDNQTLFEAYFEAGILEYWLVDARGSEVEFTIYKHTGKKYTATRAQAGGWQKSAVFGKSFRITRGTDATGNPEFTLEVR
jgi:Uma2 family endonuclease